MLSLDCPFCEHQNPADAKFCNACGSPLHLTPCEQCGAVNNLSDTHCWRCGGLLLRLQSPAAPRGEQAPGTPDRRFTEIERSGAAELATRELEKELAAIEQEIEEEARRFAGASGSAEHSGRSREETVTRPAADATPVLDEVVARRPAPAPRRSRAPTGAPRRFAAAPLVSEAAGPPRGFIGAASVTIFVAAIGGGGYFYYRMGAAPAPNPSSPPVAASIEPRVARDVGKAPERIPAPAVASAAPRVDAPVEPPAVGDTGKAAEAEPARAGDGGTNIITRIGTGASVPEPRCPAAVEAMALCEWLVRANRQ